MSGTITLAKVRLKKTSLRFKFCDIRFERTFARVGAAQHATARFFTTNSTKKFVIYYFHFQPVLGKLISAATPQP